VSDFLMGDVDSGSGGELSQTRRSRSFQNLTADSGEHEELADSELSPVQRVDRALQQNDSGVESALLYAKAWSKYARDVMSWVEKRLGLDMECAKGFARMAESAKAVAAQQDYMPFRGVYVSAFENELDYSQSLLQTATSLQTNKFMQCSLACHKKCLETLAIQCGHKKLQGRLHLFGIDFSQAAKNSADGVPFIIRKCTSEIESRALNIKGIYRLNGAKSRVEKLCQAFENGKDLVELSDLYPHDISNVLKLYLRQLPEPLILYRYYNDIIGLGKEAQSIRTDNTHSPSLGVELNRVVFKIRDLLRRLPPAHYRTLHFLITHLHRVSEHAEENKMDARNLGIIFGPTLIKPRQLDADVSLSSLVDYPYQALMVELLIQHHRKIFDGQLSPAPTTNLPLSHCSQSLLDLKESSKSHKRFSSVLPSSHSGDEVRDTHTASRHEGREDTA
ncbi:rho GTPase-activating protein 29-like isoform X2, partial [Clarias magur]